jgi:hypothetical protein
LVVILSDAEAGFEVVVVVGVVVVVVVVVGVGVGVGVGVVLLLLIVGEWRCPCCCEPLPVVPVLMVLDVTAAVTVAVDDWLEDVWLIFNSANADAICKHSVGVNSIACLGDSIAPRKGWDLTVNRVNGVCVPAVDRGVVGVVVGMVEDGVMTGEVASVVVLVELVAVVPLLLVPALELFLPINVLPVLLLTTAPTPPPLGEFVLPVPIGELLLLRRVLLVLYPLLALILLLLPVHVLARWL